MVFSSITFLFYFLPAFLFIYFLVPFRWKNLVLLAGSLVFYSYGVKDHPVYVLLLLVSILLNFVFGLSIGECRKKKERKRRLALGLLYNFGLLMVFKYLDFFTENVNGVLQYFGRTEQLPYLRLVLPIGISFYTFQISSYLIDVYRGKVREERSLIALGTYLCMFPQLIAGPIVTYSSVSRQLAVRRHSFQKVEVGLREFTIGLGIKVLIANQVGGLWTQVGAIGYESISTPLAWLGILAFSLQIYFDFYGYSLMAKGLGSMLGFQFPNNFAHPYISVSMTEFWRRWHITLGSWFRDYVYIPLGGNQGGMLLTLRNLFVVWTLTGFWHGASWNFLLWGFVLFLCIGVEKLGLLKILEKFRFLGHLYMMLLIPVTWVLFAITDLGQIKIYLTRLFPFFQNTTAAIYAGDYLKYGKMYGLSLTAGLLLCGSLPRRIYEKRKYSLGTALFLVLIFWACVYCMYMGQDDPFLYFRF